jgi:acetyl-CoA C-acetyltransferase
MSFTNGNGTEIVISTPLRTAIGTFGGAIKDVPAVDLGTTVAKGIISRSGIDAEEINQVIVGNILMAGQGMNPGRQVGINSGIPETSPAMTLNRMCASGLQAIVSAAQEIALGESDVILAGGIENMDMAPFLLPKGRYGYRMGLPEAKMGLLDHMVYDGLWDKFNDYHMGVTAENVAEQYGLSRDEVDEYSARSHQRAEKSRDEGYFDDQIVPVEIKQKKETVEFTKDEHIREGATKEGLSKLKPFFKEDGVTTGRQR